jgi:hypothetical protein
MWNVTLTESHSKKRIKQRLQPGVVMHTCNSRAWEVEAGEPPVGGQPELQSVSDHETVHGYEPNWLGTSAHTCDPGYLEG